MEHYLYINIGTIILCILTWMYMAGYANTITDKVIKKILDTDKIKKMKMELVKDMENLTNNFKDKKYVEKAFNNYVKNIPREEKIKFLEKNFIINMKV